MRVYRASDLRWYGDRLCLGSRTLAMLECNDAEADLWRIRTHDGTHRNVVNRSRARHAAVSIALAALNRRPRTHSGYG